MGRGDFAMNTVLEQHDSRVEMFFRAPGSEARNLAVYRAVHAQREGVEAAFGEPLVWDERAGHLGWKVLVPVTGGWRTPEAEWPALHERIIDVMIRMERALKNPILEGTNAERACSLCPRCQFRGSPLDKARLNAIPFAILNFRTAFTWQY